MPASKVGNLLKAVKKKKTAILEKEKKDLVPLQESFDITMENIRNRSPETARQIDQQASFDRTSDLMGDFGQSVLRTIEGAEKANAYLAMRVKRGGADAQKATLLGGQLQDKFNSSIDGFLDKYPEAHTFVANVDKGQTELEIDKNQMLENLDGKGFNSNKDDIAKYLLSSGGFSL